ncbi:MAG: putative quinol monooxygenase [Cyclobacteriaceae bacterium]
MKSKSPIFVTILLSLLIWSCQGTQSPRNGIDLKSLITRIAAIEIDPLYLDEYKSILKEEAEASVKLEPGVICIYPMYRKDNPTQLTLLEIYASEEDYKLHLKTPHFQKYKTTTVKMVKSLELIDMEPIDRSTMPEIFNKIQQLGSNKNF